MNREKPTYLNPSQAERPVYQATLEINTAHVRHNIAYFRSLIPQETKLLCMMKALAYGHGASEYARCLEEAGVDYLAVATPSEGIRLRHEGCTMPIIVFDVLPHYYQELLSLNLEPTIPSLDCYKVFEQEASIYCRRHPLSTARCHLKLDTGMHRLGITTEDLDPVLAYLQAHPNPHVRIVSIFSHLSCADDPDADAFTLGQIRDFDRMARALQEILPYRPLLHLLNSAGIERFHALASYDMVRLGIGMFGHSLLHPEKVKPTAYLRAPVLQVKQLHPGDTVGYNGKGVAADGPLTTATVAIGYGDGLNRHFGLGNVKFAINGHLAPSIGKICMDVFMLDVTGIEVKPGDTVTIFGDNPSLDYLAKVLYTIPYEILTSISYRVPRIYTHQATE